MTEQPKHAENEMDETDLRVRLATELSQFKGASDRRIPTSMIQPSEQSSCPNLEQFELAQPMDQLKPQSKLSSGPRPSYPDQVTQPFQFGQQLDQSSHRQSYNDQIGQPNQHSQQFNPLSYQQSGIIQPFQDWQLLSHVDKWSPAQEDQTSKRLKRPYEPGQHGDNHVTQPTQPLQLSAESFHHFQSNSGNDGYPSRSFASFSYHDRPVPINVEQSTSRSLSTSQYQAVPSQRNAKHAVTGLDSTSDGTNDAFWRLRREALRNELRKVEAECVKRGIKEDNNGNGKKENDPSEIEPSAVTKHHTHQTSAMNAESADDLSAASNNHFVSVNRSETVSDSAQKPYTASPLPVWLQKQLRTGVCGVYTPWKVSWGGTRGVPAKPSADKEVYPCGLCGSLQTKPGRLKNHFYRCANRRGNPGGMCWYDSPSVLAYYQQLVEKK